jgi:hypothetical protein
MNESKPPPQSVPIKRAYDLRPAEIVDVVADIASISLVRRRRVGSWSLVGMERRVDTQLELYLEPQHQLVRPLPLRLQIIADEPQEVIDEAERPGGLGRCLRG